mmetsp:Transcript_46617/g.101312  ORF Transcript_46617/g.101312 Transcript_46617/m.101312 type:complete len:281 (-) Transcript_46617:483-1325(-)
MDGVELVNGGLDDFLADYASEDGAHGRQHCGGAERQLTKHAGASWKLELTHRSLGRRGGVDALGDLDELVGGGGVGRWRQRAVRRHVLVEGAESQVEQPRPAVADIGCGRAHHREELLLERRGRRRHLALVSLPQVSGLVDELLQRSERERERLPLLLDDAPALKRLARQGRRQLLRNRNHHQLLAAENLVDLQGAVGVEGLHAFDFSKGAVVAVVEVERLVVDGANAEALAVVRHRNVLYDGRLDRLARWVERREARAQVDKHGAAETANVGANKCYRI